MTLRRLTLFLFAITLLLATHSATTVFAGGGATAQPCPPSGVWPPGCVPPNNGGAGQPCPPSGKWPAGCIPPNNGSGAGQPCPPSGKWPAGCIPPNNGGGAGQPCPPSGKWPAGCIPNGGGHTGELQIISFNASNRPQPDGSDQVSFSWNVANAQSVEIWVGYAYDYTMTKRQVGASGSAVLTSFDSTLRLATAGIIARNAQGQVVEQTMQVRFGCVHDYFFPDATVNVPLSVCAATAAESFDVVWQPFERGFMVYAQARVDEDGGLDAPFYARYGNYENYPPAYIAVFIEQSSVNPHNPRYFVEVDQWQEGQPVDDPSLQPPDGLLQPVRGFGKMWRDIPSLREQLGWATAPEMPSTIRYQWVDYPIFFGFNIIYYEMPMGMVAMYTPERSNFNDNWAYIGVNR